MLSSGVSGSVIFDLAECRSGPIKNFLGRIGLASRGCVSVGVASRIDLGLRGGGGVPSGTYIFFGLHLRGISRTRL